MQPKAAHVYLVALKCCLCICATLSPHSLIDFDINSCALGYFLAIYQPWWSNACGGKQGAPAAGTTPQRNVASPYEEMIQEKIINQAQALWIKWNTFTNESIPLKHAEDDYAFFNNLVP